MLKQVLQVVYYEWDRARPLFPPSQSPNSMTIKMSPRCNPSSTLWSAESALTCLRQVARKSYLILTSPRASCPQNRLLRQNSNPRRSRRRKSSRQGLQCSKIKHWSRQKRLYKRKWPRRGVVHSVNEGSVQATASAMDSPVHSTNLES